MYVIYTTMVKKSYDDMLIDFLNVSPYFVIVFRILLMLGLAIMFLYFLITISINMSESEKNAKKDKKRFLSN